MLAKFPQVALRLICQYEGGAVFSIQTLMGKAELPVVAEYFPASLRGITLASFETRASELLILLSISVARNSSHSKRCEAVSRLLT